MPQAFHLRKGFASNLYRYCRAGWCSSEPVNVCTTILGMSWASLVNFGDDACRSQSVLQDSVVLLLEVLSERWRSTG
eukprot:9467327-Pyramimonas_sp.AAC.2